MPDREHDPTEASAAIGRLQRDLVDAQQQLVATSEVLTALGRSSADPDAVLGTIVKSARRLCHADVAQIYLVDGPDRYRLARSSGLSPEFREWIGRHPIARDRATLVGRVGLDRRTQQVVDVLADPEYGRQELQRMGGFRTTLSAPMLLDGEVVGVLAVWRTEVDPFDDDSCALLTSFAAQGAVAIRSVELVRALEERTSELAHKIEQLEALGQVSQVVSSSLDLDEVLTTIVRHAVELTGTDGGSLMEYDESARRFRVRTAYGTSNDVLEALRHTEIGIDDTLVGRAATGGRPLQAEDLGSVPSDPHISVLAAAGWRSLLAVPMLRQGKIIGALVVRRRRTGAFSADVSDLLETFASQSALALVNARLYRELERKSTELEEASRHKSEFLASMSHELRTPLNAVLGFSEVLLERMFGDINERQEEYLRDIWSSGKHLLELLNEILDLSKVEAGRMALERSTFSMRGCLEYGLAQMRERAARHGIQLELDVADDPDVVESDELRVKQVVLNLLSNAVKFTPDGGRVSVQSRRVGGDMVVTVTDTGIGIPPEDHERIFESFQQGGRGPSREEGTGLGLTLCRRLVELLGGRMWMTSEVGVGSSFSFSVPLVPVTQSTRAQAAAGKDGPLILIVEDDRSSSDLLSAYLEGSGFTVATAADGVEGLSAARQLAPAAVVLDIRLPRMDGWELLGALKRDAAMAAVPVVVVTMVDERAKGMALGAAEYLVKPVARESLLTALERVHVRPRPRADERAALGGASP